MLKPLKRPFATAGATRCRAALVRPVALAAKVPGIVAALLIALIAACTNEMPFTPPPLSPSCPTFCCFSGTLIWEGYKRNHKGAIPPAVRRIDFIEFVVLCHC